MLLTPPELHSAGQLLIDQQESRPSRLRPLRHCIVAGLAPDFHRAAKLPCLETLFPLGNTITGTPPGPLYQHQIALSQ